MTGRRNAGMARMEKLAQGSSGDFQALALSQLSIWKLDGGDKKAAADLAKQAAAASPESGGTKDECHCRSDRGGRRDQLRFKGGGCVCAAVREEISRGAAVIAGRVCRDEPVGGWTRFARLLAWAYVETGAIDQAASLVGQLPFVLTFGEPQFTSPIFPRYLFVRSAVLEHQGKRDEAQG